MSPYLTTWGPLVHTLSVNSSPDSDTAAKVSYFPTPYINQLADEIAKLAANSNRVFGHVLFTKRLQLQYENNGISYVYDVRGYEAK